MNDASNAAEGEVRQPDISLVPRVTVCIATCNHRRYIEQCLSSVLDQSPEDILEILIGDDASDDGTSDIIREFATRHPGLVFHFRHNQRLGAFENTRYLFKRAKGAYIACLDGDDYWCSGKLRRQVARLDDDPACAAVYTNAITIHEDGRRIGLFNDVGDERFDLGALIERGNFLNYSSMVFRAQSIAPILAEKNPILDYAVHLIHAGFGSVEQLRQPLTVYRVHATGSMVATDNNRVRELYWEAIQMATRLGVSDHSLALGLADFLRRIFIRSMRTWNIQLLSTWLPRVLGVSPYGRLRTLWLTLGSITHTVLRTGLGLFRRAPNGGRLKILHRR